MKAHRLLAIALTLVFFGCEGRDKITGPAAQNGASKIIQDGAHGGNKDFFFLPPLVPLPLNNVDFEVGKFNNALRPSLTIEICELDVTTLPAYHNSQGLPTDVSPCASGKPLVKKFNAGSIQLVNLPLRQNGWWSLLNLPPDGFYYALWDTRASSLSVSKYYRIKVLLDGSTEPLGIADVDPMSSLLQWKYSNTGQVIQMVDDVLLPIPFRIENGGGSTLCGGANICASATIATQSTTTQVLQTPGNNGPIAGLVVPPNWLPPGSPANVVVTIRAFDTGHNDEATGTQEHPCHAGLALEQFNGCFTFTTTPTLLPSAAAGGHQFLNPATVVACFVLHDTPDPREPYAQLWASGPNEQTRPLVSVSDALVLTVDSEHDCGSNFSTIVSNTSTNPLVRFASAGWHKIRGGIGRFFGVKTAYAVDLGLGGLTLDFSNIGPAINAHVGSGEFLPDFSVLPGSTTLVGARVVGTLVHDGSGLGTGIGGYPVVFAIGTPDAGGFSATSSTGPFASNVTATTISGIVTPGSMGSGGGFANATWKAPEIAGHYTLTASSPVALGTVTYHVFVRPELASIQGDWQNENPSTRNVVNFVVGDDGDGGTTVQVFGQCSPDDCDWGTTTADVSDWDHHQQLTAVWDQGFAIKTLTITWLSATRMQVTTHADFTDADGRTDYTVTEFFQRPT